MAAGNQPKSRIGLIELHLRVETAAGRGQTHLIVTADTFNRPDPIEVFFRADYREHGQVVQSQLASLVLDDGNSLEEPIGGDDELATPGPGSGNTQPLGQLLVIGANTTDAGRRWSGRRSSVQSDRWHTEFRLWWKHNPGYRSNRGCRRTGWRNASSLCQWIGDDTTDTSRSEQRRPGPVRRLRHCAHGVGVHGNCGRRPDAPQPMPVHDQLRSKHYQSSPRTRGRAEHARPGWSGCVLCRRERC